jgi:hypothetical protein
MKVTGHGDEGRQLQKKGCPQKVPVEPGGYAGAPDRGKMAENNTADTDGQTGRLVEKILNKHNLYEAYKKVKANKGGTGCRWKKSCPISKNTWMN